MNKRLQDLEAGEKGFPSKAHYKSPNIAPLDLFYERPLPALNAAERKLRGTAKQNELALRTSSGSPNCIEAQGAFGRLLVKVPLS